MPTELLDRVSSLDWFISIAGLPVRPHSTGRRCVRRRATLVGAGVLGGVITIAAPLLPGMRGVDGALAPLPAVLEAAR